MLVAAGAVVGVMQLARAPSNSDAARITVVNREPSASGSPIPPLSLGPTPRSGSRSSGPPPVAAASRSTSRTPSASPTPTHRLVAPGVQAQRVQTLRLINAVRRSSPNLPSLSSNAKLQSAAQDYAEHLALDGQLSDTDGSQIGDRVTAAGYQWQSVGESLGLGEHSPAEIVAAWMESSEDRANLLSPTFVDVGIGIATRPDGRIVWCIDFGTPA